MPDLFGQEFFWRSLIASVLGGITCGLIGVWIILLNIPFVGVAMSHSALAGAIVGLLLGINPLIAALFFCFLASLIIGPLADKGEVSMNVSISVVFSLALGIAFLGLGLIKGPKTAALNFLWGNILTISNQQLLMLLIAMILIAAVVIGLYKEVLAVLFNREKAKAVGLPERFVLYLLIFICGITVSLNLSSIGGLLIFSLITNAPLSAYQLTYNLKTMYILSAVFGVISCLTGLLISYLFNLSSSAVIIMTSCLIFAFCLYFSPKRRKLNES